MTMTGVADKAPRRSSNRAAKTVALSALANKKAKGNLVTTTTTKTANTESGSNTNRKGTYDETSREHANRTVHPLHVVVLNQSPFFCRARNPTDQEATGIHPAGKKHNHNHSSIKRNPPKKRWKAKGQLIATAPQAGTPHRSAPPPVLPFQNPKMEHKSNQRCHHGRGTRKTTTKALTSSTKTAAAATRTKTKLHPRNTEQLPLQKPPSSPLVLARLNLDGASVPDTNDDGNNQNTNQDRQGAQEGSNRGESRSSRDDPRRRESFISSGSSLRSLRWVNVVTTTHHNNHKNSPEAPSRTTTFPVKLYRMVEETTLKHPGVCRWSRDGKSIEIDSRSPELLSILRRHFKHSRWLSFTRQLNNYGFQHFLQTGSISQPHPIKSYRHPKFHRGISDPTVLIKNLPYLPGKRKRDDQESQPKSPVAAAPVGKRPKKRTAAATAARSNARSAVNTVTPLAKVGLQVTPTRKGARGTKSRAAAAKKTKKSMIRQQHQHQGVVGDFFKTPSPRYRGTKAMFMSSPPPLSHYLQPKNNTAPHEQRLLQQSSDPPQRRPNHIDSKGLPPPPSSENGSPLPSSLLTVNFVMTPSPAPNDEPTPRAHNLSSSLVASASLSQSGATTTTTTTTTSASSPDGVRMLSWAAQAVESPDFPKKKDDDNTRHTPDAGNKSTNCVRFMEEIGCSPIIPNNVLSLSLGSAEAIHRCGYPPAVPTTNEGTSFTPTFSPATYKTAISNNKNNGGSSSIGPSPLSFRNHQETEVELELLRNCLEDVFVATTSSTRTTTTSDSTEPANGDSVVSSSHQQYDSLATLEIETALQI